jgi:hypothetical protein
MKHGVVRALLGVSLAVQGAVAAPAWEQVADGYALKTAQGVIACDSRGKLAVRVNGQPSFEVGFFLWHGAYVYETLAAGRVDVSAVRPDGALRLTGLWGARDGAAPVRYAMTLTPGADRVSARLELEKTGPLTLVDGVWAAMWTTVASNDVRSVYLMPTAHAALGSPVDGVFKQVFVGQEEGPSLFFSGDGLCYLRSRAGRGGHGFEVKASKVRDVPLGEKMTAALTIGFASMPKILRPAVTGRAALAVAATAPQDVPLYGKCEIAVALHGTWDNPYDPDEIALDAEVVTASGRRYRMPGFFMVPHRREQVGTEDLMSPSGEGRWCVRLAATETGPMRVRLTARDRSGTAVYDLPQPVRVTARPDAKGFIRVSRADPRYLAYDNGEGYVPIGHNVPICRGSNGMPVGDILAKMADSGENWNRWWMSKSGLGLEWEKKLGWYRQAQAALLDGLLDDAGRLGMSYMLCMDTHQDFRQDGWKANLYNVAQGGPCKTAGEWFTDTSARNFYRKRLRYTVARWGYSPHVMCWEFGNEFEGWADASQDAIIAWHREMAPVLAALDPYEHLISTSWWSKTGPEACWQIPELAVVQTHSYANNDLNTALEARAFCLTQWNRFEKPHLFAEFGIRSHNFSADADPTGRAIHNTSWAAVASGCCGAAMPWWHENYIEPKALYFHFRALRSFVAGLPFGRERWRQVQVDGPGVLTTPARPSQRDIVLLTRSGFRRAAAELFAVGPDGAVAAAEELLALLHGSGHRDLANPPSFDVSFPADGAFVVHVDKVSNSGDLRVFVDDALVLERPLPCGEGHGKSWRYVEQWKLWESVYDEAISVPVKAGRRRIRVENHGKDWVSVVRYVFEGCRVTETQEVNAFALAAESAAIVWLQNGDSTWVNHARHADEIRLFPASAYTLHGLPDGAYEVEWWETWKGAPLKRETVHAKGARLTLHPGAIATDTAAKIRRLP